MRGSSRVGIGEGSHALASGNLHTNFQLDQDGEYLALISPAGTASTEFTPVFPFQSKNVSFGSGFGGTVTVTDGTPHYLHRRHELQPRQTGRSGCAAAYRTALR